MSPQARATISTQFLQHLSEQCQGIRIWSPSDKDWNAVRRVWSHSAPEPAVIVRPQTSNHVQELVRQSISQNVDFVVRSGGHDVLGRSQLQGGLVIDMRDINSVQVAEDKRTARVGGGILTRELTKNLGEHGLVTPTGPIASIGYVGWATLGGYGPLAGKYGLGVDQIVKAQYVNAQGNFIEADDDDLAVVRGGGGALGIITELIIKTYPLKKILAGSLAFESSDKEAAWGKFSQGYNSLLDSGDLPISLAASPAGLNIPGIGSVFTLMVVWADDNHENGREWIGKIANLGTCVMNTVKETTCYEYTVDNENLAGPGGYGRAWTLNLRSLTPTTAGILAKHNALIPAPGSLFSVHRVVSTEEYEYSVFQPRETHYWLEIVGASPDPETAQRAEDWATALKDDLLENDSSNVLHSRYLGFSDEIEVDMKVQYGGHYEKLIEMKKANDPTNAFMGSLPRLSI